MSVKHQAPRGTRDLLPDETPLWRWAEATARGSATFTWPSREKRILPPST